jgi:hypothetical protein
MDSAVLPPSGATRAAMAARSASAGAPLLARATAAGVSAGIEGHAGGRAAGLVAAQVGPVAAVLDPQEIPEVDAGLGEGVPQHVFQRGDQGFVAVSDRHGRGQPQRPEDAGGVRGDVRGHGGVGWIGQVIPERDLDAITRRRRADHDKACVRHEPEQVRHDRQQRCG